jgi:hypothetical protein
MENLKGKFASEKSYHMDEATADALVKKIPIVGQVYSGTEAVGSLLHKAFPSVFNTSGSFSAKVANAANSKQLAQYQNKPLWFIFFTDGTFTTPFTVLNGIITMNAFDSETDPNYLQMVSDGGVIHGVATKPIIGGYYPLFPNVLQKYLESIKAQTTGTIAGDAALITGTQGSTPGIGVSDHNYILIVAAIILIIILITS